MRAKGLVPGRFGQCRSDAGLEPLPTLIEQRDQGDRRATNLRSETSQVVERRLGWCIQDMVAAQSRQPLGFVLGQGRRLHAGSSGDFIIG